MAPSSPGALGAPSYLFFLSYARADADRYFERFLEDLVEEVRAGTGRATREDVCFRDARDIELGAPWPMALDEAISSCRALVALWSPTYFTREYCGKEWAAFNHRVEALFSGSNRPALAIPVLWRPLDPIYGGLPDGLKVVQYTIAARLGASYSDGGLRSLMTRHKRSQYTKVVEELGKIIVGVIHTHELPPSEIRVREFRDAFGGIRPLATDDPRLLRELELRGTFPPPEQLDLEDEGGLRGSARQDDLLSRVEKIHELREPGARLERIRGLGPAGDYLRVTTHEGGIARIRPINAIEDDLTIERFGAFLDDIHERYRKSDPYVVSTLVYGGAPAPANLIAEATRRRVHLVSFIEYQGLIDFRSYVTKQTSHIAVDPIYPPRLYVDQRMSFDLGRGAEESNDALATIREWLDSPHGRFILILGDFGTGKTFLLHELARRLGEEHGGLVPVLLQMRALEKGRSLDALLAQHFALEGMEDFSPARFRYMLEEGRIALLFDGFDELALRVTYPRATEHFDTLLQASRGAAKVVVTSRRQHFISDQQVKQALLEKVETVAGRRIATLQSFDDHQIRRFLVRFCGDSKAEARLSLLERVKDLMGLSRIPRLLGFIAELPEEDLEKAAARGGEITAAGLYRILLDRWLIGEFERVHPRGAPPGLSVEDRWHGVTALALRLWQKTDRFVDLAELEVDAALVIRELDQAFDPAIAAFQLGSGTLLVRDEEGNFSFLHQSVLEWLVANQAAKELTAGRKPAVLAAREMSPLMASFVIDLAEAQTVLDWAWQALSEASTDIAKRNAFLVIEWLEKAGVAVEIRGAINLAGKDLRGQDLAGQALSGADLTGANLSNASLVRTRLAGAQLAHATLKEADLTEAILSRADLSGADFSGARLLGADLRSIKVDRETMLRQAKLVGTRLDPVVLEVCDTTGAAMGVEALAPHVAVRKTAINALTLHPRCGLVSGSDDGSIRVWHFAAGCEVRRLTVRPRQVKAVAFSSDGTTLASADDQKIRLWNPATGGEISIFADPALVRALAFNRAGSILASGSEDRTIRCWSPATRQELRRLEGHEAPVRTLAFSPTDPTLASGSTDGTIRIWNTDSGRELAKLGDHSAPVLAIAFNPNGTTLASSSTDRMIHLWHVSMHAELQSLSGHETSVWTLAFSPDGTILASGSDDRSIRLWDPSCGREVRRLVGHEDPVRALAFSPDGHYLASGSLDNTIRLWEVATGRCLAMLVPLPEGWVAFSPDGRYKYGGIVAGGFWHAIGLCRFEVGELDPYVRGLRLADDASFLDLPPWAPTEVFPGEPAS